MTLQQIQPQLLALSSAEKAQAIQLLVASLDEAWPGIEKTPNVMGGDACIRETRIPVWLRVSQVSQPLPESARSRCFDGARSRTSQPKSSI